LRELEECKENEVEDGQQNKVTEMTTHAKAQVHDIMCVLDHRGNSVWLILSMDKGWLK
jgi:hypothetical protein